ncbi:zinc finger protein 62 homolog [Gouania willdenowi]|uniref:zinc finger protein 62 homolog n=1 Tax=Gouania willdenowi TaxID=441366 RepID=UPI001054919C|nr:zinc finger protein 62 homolog [Gouania willdenowi]
MELQTFKDDCSPQKNIVFKRLQYWSHQRTAGTSVDTFITELRHKSKECEFGMSENDMLRDKLVFSITDCHLKERLLQERGLTLHRAIEICRATEQEKTPLQAMKTEHGMQQVPVDGEMKMILPDKSLHHNTSKHLGYQSVPNMDQSVKLVLAAFMPKVHLHRLQLQQPSVTDCVFSERKNVEQLLPERLHIKEEPETLSEGQEGNQLCRHQETNSAACPVKCEDEEEKPQASQLHWRQQTQINIKEEPSSCTLDKFMKRQSVGINSKGPEAARNPDHSSLVLQGPDGTETDSSHTEDRNTYDDGDCYSWQNPLSEVETNDFDFTRNKRKMSDSSKNNEMGRKATKTQISSFQHICSNQNVRSESSSTPCVGEKKVRLNEESKEARQTGDKPFRCDVCSKCFKLKSTLNQHLIVHTGEKPYSCDICCARFTRKSHRNKHIEIHTGEKPFQCSICRKCFIHISHLNSHMEVHKEEKPFRCDFCGKSFRKKYDLKVHKLIHTGEKPFRCDVCSKGFSHKSNLNVHRRVHTEEKRFSCKVCRKCFRYNVSLKLHMKLHTKERPYRCDVCKKCFKLKDTLKRHMLVHTEERPIQCDVCSKCFKLNDSLKRHMLVHTEERPYQCDVCSKCFKRKTDVNLHMLVHTEEKPFSCDVCSKGFRKNYELKIHKSTHT